MADRKGPLQITIGGEIATTICQERITPLLRDKGLSTRELGAATLVFRLSETAILNFILIFA